MPNITMSQKIKTLLETTKCTSKELADFVHTNPSTVSHWITRNVTPTANFLPHIAQFFGITLEELYTEHPENFLEKSIIEKREAEREEKKEVNAYTSMLDKNFSKTFHESLLEISKNAKLAQDTEELFGLFQNLDAWRRHIVLAYTYEQNEKQKLSEIKNLPL